MIDNNWYKILIDNSEKYPDKIAYRFLKDGEDQVEEINYLKLREKVLVTSSHVKSKSRSGDNILLVFPSGLDYVTSFFSCLISNVSAVTAYPPRLRGDKVDNHLMRLQSIAKDSQVKVVLSNSKTYELIKNSISKIEVLKDLDWILVDEISEKVNENENYTINNNELAFLQYTSGSTALPKGVMVTHKNLLHQQEVLKEAFNSSTESELVGWLPLFHDLGLIAYMMHSMYLGATYTFMAPASFIQRPYRWLRALSKYKGTISGAPNFAYDLCCDKVSETELLSLNLKNWESALNAAEPVRVTTMKRFYNRFKSRGFKYESLNPCYGMAESTLLLTGSPKENGGFVYQSFNKQKLKEGIAELCSELESDSVLYASSGKSLLSQNVIIVDPKSRTICDDRVVGEVWVNSESVCGGYWKKEEVSDATFRAKLSQEDKKYPTGPYLKTGDYAFRYDDHFFIGSRLKDLIIIRGSNYAPQDIEISVEGSHAYLRPDHCAAFSVDIDNEEKLVVVQEIVRTKRNEELSEVIESIRSVVINNFGIEPFCITLIYPSSLPKTSSGKIQRSGVKKAWLENELKVLDQWKNERSEHYSVKNDIVEMNTFDSLCCIVSGSLKCDIKKNLDRDFISLGMDSLAAMEICGSIETKLKVKCSIEDLYTHSNILDLCKTISRDETNYKPTNDLIVSNDKLLMSYGQLSIWNYMQKYSQGHAYDTSFKIKFHNGFDKARAETIFNKLLRKYQNLTYAYKNNVNGKPEIVREVHKIKINSVDNLENINRHNFNIEEGVLFNVTEIISSDIETCLLLEFHHIAIDLISFKLVISEFLSLYCEDKESLEEKEYSSDYYSSWQEQWLETESANQQLKFWLDQKLENSPMLELPYDRDVLEKYENGHSYNFIIPKDISDSVSNLVKQLKISKYVFYSSVYHFLLYKYCNQESFNVGTAVSGRSNNEFMSTVGMLMNTIVTKVNIQSKVPFREYVETVKRNHLRILENQNIPFFHLFNKISEGCRDNEMNELFNTFFSFDNFLSDNPYLSIGAGKQNCNNVEFSIEMPNQQESLFDLSLHFFDCNEELKGVFRFNKSKFNPSKIVRFAENYIELIQNILKNNSCMISDLSVLGQKEKVFYEEKKSNIIKKDTKDSIYQLLEKHAKNSPESTAVITSTGELTYKELNDRANQLARFLINIGVKENERIGICFPRNSNILIAVYAVFKMCGTYVPIDPTHPEERINYMLENSSVSTIISESQCKEILDKINGSKILIDEKANQISSEEFSNLNKSHDEERIAYIVYTSGSTGKPKGILTTHKNLSHYVINSASNLGHTKEDTMIALATLSFDMSTMELYTPLSIGAKVALVSPKEINDGNMLESVIQKMGVTIMMTTPSVWRMFLNSGWKGSPTLKIMCGAEHLDYDLADKLLKKGKSFWNVYGPTETTATVCHKKIETPTEITIGNEIPNTEVFILDNDLNKCPIGAWGELHIGGDGTAKSYLELEQLTSEKFIINTQLNSIYDRFYKSGDIGRFLENGEIELKGRVDDQFKLRGFRIESKEIINTLNLHANVKMSLIRLHSFDESDKRIIAYIILENSIDCLNFEKEIKDFLKPKLPDYMIPAHIFVIEDVPVTANKKVDYKKLPLPGNEKSNTQKVIARDDEEIIDKVLRVWSTILKIEDIETDMNFFDMGGDSLLMVQLCSELNNEFNLDIQIAQLYQYPTIESISEYLENKLESRV